MKCSEFHRKLPKRGKERGWFWTGESEGCHYIYEDKDGNRYPVSFHGTKELPKVFSERLKRTWV